MKLRISRFAWATICIALLFFTSGCLTYYSNADEDFGKQGAQIIHRNYLVTAKTPFALASTHPLPIGIGKPFNYGDHITVELEVGTVLQTEFIQHYWSYGIDGDQFSNYIVQAIVTGSHKGARVGIAYSKLLPPPKIALIPQGE